MRGTRLMTMLVAGLGLAACEGANRTLEMGVEDAPVVPAVRGYAAGEEILFVHTEASDSAIAKTLTDMMRSPAWW